MTPAEYAAYLETGYLPDESDYVLDEDVELTPYQQIARKHPELMHAEIIFMLAPATDQDCPF